MIHHNAILKNDEAKMRHILKYYPVEHPVVLQLGGCDPQELARSARIGADLGYDEINLNVGCPSPRVQSGSFGACLMKEPALVAKCMAEMQAAVNIPCTVKCRLGVDDHEDYEFVRNFIDEVSRGSKTTHFVMHARNAILNGLSPAENRTIPPLKYDYVYQLKKDFPNLNFTLNGGIKTVDQAKKLLEQNNLYGCMIGRTAYENPWELAKIDDVIYNKPSKNYSKREVLELYGEFIDKVIEEQPNMSRPTLIKPILNLFVGCKNNAKYRQYLSEVQNIRKHESMSEMLAEAMRILDSTDPSYLLVRKFEEKERKEAMQEP
jgi:tRNA-dihydrouridine synthase A